MTMTITYATAPVGGAFQTNTFETGDQLLPDVVGLTGGAFVSAYNNASATNGRIVLNFYDADHAVIGSFERAHVGPNTDAVGQPKLAELAGGNVVVLWDDNNGADSDAGPHASIYTPLGGVVAEDIDLFASDFTGYSDVDVAALNDGGFAVSYSTGAAISFRIFDAAGVQQGAPTLASTSGTPSDSQIIRLSDGAFAIAWTDTDPADDVIKGRIFEANGTPRTGELTLSPGAAANTQPSIAALKNGGFAIVYKDAGWDENSTDGDPGVTLQIVSSAGVAGAPIHANAGYPGEENDPDVTVLANGFIAVTWTLPFSASDDDIYGRVFDQTGAVVTGEINLGGSGDNESASAVAALLAGQFITSWQDPAADAGGGGRITSQITEITRVVVGDSSAESALFNGDVLRHSIDGGGGDDSIFCGDSADTVYGGDGADYIHGNGGDNLLHGGDGEDSLYGGFDNDTLWGDLGNDHLRGWDGGDLIEGGDGADTMQGEEGSDTLDGGAGNDLIYGADVSDPFTSPDGDSMLGGDGVDRIHGASGADSVDGGGGTDKLVGGAGADAMSGGFNEDNLKGQSGADTLEGGFSADTLNGGVGDDVLYAMAAGDIDGSGVGDGLNGANGHDTIFGSWGADTIVGLAGKDVIDGRGDADTISGGTGKDVLHGGLGADHLTGGGDKDTFDFDDVLDSAAGAEDLITDLGNQDFVDLSGIDARSGSASDQAFTLVAAFGGHKGELVVAFHTSGPYAGLTTIQGDVDGDAAADFIITVTGDKHVFDNFVL